MESKIIKSLIVLGVPGVALGVFYLLFRNFNFQFDAIPPVLSAVIVIVFLLIVGGVTLFALHKWAPPKIVNEGQEAALHRLEEAWKDVNYIDSDNLIGPDVNKAANALDMTSIYWRNGFITQQLLFDRYGRNFCELFEQIDSCDKQVPGYNKPKKYCKDFLPTLVRSTYKEIKSHGT